MSSQQITNAIAAVREAAARTPWTQWGAIFKTKWRGLRMALGFPIPGTSPAIQQERGLNRDATIFYKKGEGAKLRDKSASPE